MLRNWGNNIFKEDDIEKGRELRKVDSKVDLDKLCKDVAGDFIDFPKFKSLDELIYWIDDLFAKIGPEQLLLNAANFILRPEHIQPTLLRWKAEGYPSLDIFAPYSIYFYKVNLFYILGINFELIKKGKKSKTHLDLNIYQFELFLNLSDGLLKKKKGLSYIAAAI